MRCLARVFLIFFLGSLLLGVLWGASLALRGGLSSGSTGLALAGLCGAGIGVFGVTSFVLYRLPPRPRRYTRTKQLIALVVTLPSLVVYYAVFALLVSFTRPPGAVLDALGPVCRDGAAAGAAAYDPAADGPHRLVVLDESGEPHVWTASPARAWRPSRVSEVELVACISPTAEEFVDSCTGAEGESIDRFSQSVRVRLLAAQSGELLASDEFVDEPRPCRADESGERITGYVPFDWVETWLREYVE